MIYKEGSDMESTRFPGLTGNQLKLIALITMTIDHIGVSLLPQYTVLRIIGRLAFPIFAWMIAEGCRYTRNRRKYLLSMWGLASICQIVYFFAMGSLYMCVLVTFGLSIGLIYLVDWAKNRSNGARMTALAAILGVFFLARVLPDLIPRTDYGIDYGLWGVLLPVLVYFGKDKEEKLRNFAFGQVLLALGSGSLQWFSLATVPLLALYNGKRGKRKMKYLFYIYYPAHLVVIYLLSLL